MATIDYEEKLNSKPYRFFDLLFRLIVINLMTIVLSCTVVCLFPSIVAATATIKEGSGATNVFKQYFRNFAHYFLKSFFVGLILLVLLGVDIYAIYFYTTAQTEVTFTSLFLSAGFVVTLVCGLIIIFLSVHLELLIIYFESFTVGDIFRTSFFVTFRYFLTTLILFILHLVILGLFVACLLVDRRLLSIFILIGITLPLFLEIKVTAPVYYKFSKIDFEKIMARVDEEEENEE